MDCHQSPFHLECVELHYQRAHPRPQEKPEEDEQAKEEEILQQESEEARTQWVAQMTNLSKLAMPLGRKITSIVVAFVSVGLAVESFWPTTSADAPVSLLK